MWKQWTHQNVKYLALKTQGGHWHIVDENGNSYGTFRHLPKRSDLGIRYPAIDTVVCLLNY
jgi:hypothetical protein